ncbi:MULTISPECIES: hypothetical protein [unclassified Luteococcus]|uniref:hypothetical protein n=1 Tax=unclassified Luteococcus TaxID=2639923 RepID=UPI00313C6A68
MTSDLLLNLKDKVFGDRRDQRQALRDAGFADEATATAWAKNLLADAPEASEVELIGRIRRARPDLTGRTAAYIARQTITRG